MAVQRAYSRRWLRPKPWAVGTEEVALGAEAQGAERLTVVGTEEGAMAEMAGLVDAVGVAGGVSAKEV
jgi:hypothetical protein